VSTSIAGHLRGFFVGEKGSPRSGLLERGETEGGPIQVRSRRSEGRGVGIREVLQGGARGKERFRGRHTMIARKQDGGPAMSTTAKEHGTTCNTQKPANSTTGQDSAMRRRCSPGALGVFS